MAVWSSLGELWWHLTLKKHFQGERAGWIGPWGDVLTAGTGVTFSGRGSTSPNLTSPTRCNRTAFSPVWQLRRRNGRSGWKAEHNKGLGGKEIICECGRGCRDGKLGIQENNFVALRRFLWKTSLSACQFVSWEVMQTGNPSWMLNSLEGREQVFHDETSRKNTKGKEGTTEFTAHRT